MNLCDIQQIKALLARHGFHFSKAKGQNFLTQSWVPRQMVEEASIDEDCGVVEIGPGIGPLTEQLCARAGKVVAVEVDQSLKPVLAETMAGKDNLTILWGDALKMDMAQLVAEQLPGLRPVACANLPYYITSPVLGKLLECRQFETVTVMVQKEVAQRIQAAAGTPNYSAFSVFCQYYAEPEILFDVPADCFVPRPKVTSAVIRLTRREAPVCEILSETLFFRVVKASFAQRRKTLVNGLSSAFGSRITKAELQEVLRQCGLPETVRGETLDVPGFAAVANALQGRLEA